MATGRLFGYAFDERFLAHDTGTVAAMLPDGTLFTLGPHASNAGITGAIDGLLRASGMAARFHPIEARAASEAELTLAHGGDYVERVRLLSETGGGDAGDVAPVGPHSYAAARLAAGSAIEAMDAIIDGTVCGAYVLARPPGHHAMPNMGMGYCLFNNVAIAVNHGRRRGLRRTLILDWDVHHGNGTQAVFYDDPSVLFISLHQDNWYPLRSGGLGERGAGDGIGYSMNVPLPPGTGDRGYLEAFETLVAPAARRFRPDLIAVSAGQDAGMLDPLGRMMVTTAGFAALGTRVRALAEELCDGQVLIVQEGGYSATYTPLCTLAVLEGVSGIASGAEDPYYTSSEQENAGRILLPTTIEALAAAREAHRSWLDG